MEVGREQERKGSGEEKFPSIPHFPRGSRPQRHPDGDTSTLSSRQHLFISNSH